MKLIIEDDEGRKTVVPLVRDEISIGRLEGNTIRLTERNVSRRHARLLKQNGSIYVEDLGSYTGVRVNGDKISARQSVKEGDLIEIGDYDLQIEGGPSKADGDTNPTVKEEMPKDRTPPLAAPPPPAARPQPAPAPAPAPRPTRNDGATAMIRLSDLQRPGDTEERDLAAHEQPRLVGLTGTLRGREFPIRRSVVKVGRTDDNDISIDHQSMSRQHARLQLEGGAWQIYDNKSANGVRVNGDEYQKAAVKPGDTLELGHVKFRFCAPGEAFTPPREAPASVAAPSAPASAPAHVDAPAGKSKLPLIIGGVVGVVALAVVGIVVATGGKAKGPDTAKNCGDAQGAIASKNWGEAIKQLNIVQGMAGTCPFPIDEALRNAKSNNEAKLSLDEAKELLEAGKFRQAIQVLKGIAPGSEYDAEIKLSVGDAVKSGVRKYSDEAQDALDKNKLEEAKNFIDDIESLDPEAAALPLLQKAFQEKKAKAAAAEQAAKAPAKPPIEERNKQAEAKLAEANNQIRGGNLAGGIDLLQQVIQIDPAPQYVGKAYRNLGVANARGGKTDEAIKYYKLYLKVQPDAPERAKILELIENYEKAKK